MNFYILYSKRINKDALRLYGEVGRGMTHKSMSRYAESPCHLCMTTCTWIEMGSLEKVRHTDKCFRFGRQMAFKTLIIKILGRFEKLKKKKKIQLRCFASRQFLFNFPPSHLLPTLSRVGAGQYITSTNKDTALSHDENLIWEHLPTPAGLKFRRSSSLPSSA